MVCIVHQNRSLIDHLDFVEAVGMGLGCLAEHILLDTKQHCWDKVWMPKSQVLVDHHPCNAAMGRDMQDMQSTDHPNSCHRLIGASGSRWLGAVPEVPDLCGWCH
mmetsp:Transcript_2630/g.2846  ORF Transcript_2630/g.2846 Transcript_2630/m.2846 type:complete len:105 (-) Transcript_2630:96-410(-)